MDDIQKRVGVPYSASRNHEKANKKKTRKARRQAGRKATKEND